MKYRILIINLAFCVMQTIAQHQLEVEAAARASVVNAARKKLVFESLEYLTISKIKELGTVGEIEAKLVPEFVHLAQKSSMISENQADYVERFNAMAEVRAKALGLESSPVAIPAQVKGVDVSSLQNFQGRFTSMREIPKDVALFIGAGAWEKWPERADMREYERGLQQEAWCRYLNFAQNRDPVIQGLVKMGVDKWEKNYSMIAHHVETRYESFKRGEARKWELEYIAKAVEASGKASDAARTTGGTTWSGTGLPAGMMKRKGF